MKGNFSKGRQAVASAKAKKDLAEVHLVAYDSVRNEDHKCEPIRVRIDVQFHAALAHVGGLCVTAVLVRRCSGIIPYTIR